MTRIQKYTYLTLKYLKHGFWAICFLAVLASSSLQAQPVLDARNIGLGGGGAAYLTGIEANFYNPANLAVYDRKGTYHLGLGTVGTFFEPVLSSGTPKSQFQRYKNTFLPYSPGELDITADERTSILEENYPGNNASSEHLSRADVLWGGAVWKKDNKALSLALRSRAGSRIDVGRGWYSGETLQDDSTLYRDFTLERQLQVLHEISFGFAQEFKFFNGLMPRINKLYIGIAPKVVIGGAYENASFLGRYQPGATPGPGTFSRSFSFYATGDNTDMVNRYIASGDPQTAIDSELNSGFLTQPTGYGAGIDFGLTYIIPLGTDISLLDEGEQRRPLEKSLRIAFSVTNIGFIRYSQNPVQLQSQLTSSPANSQSPLNTQFVGSSGQVPVFFEQAGELPNPFFEVESISDADFTNSLPASFNAGAVLDIDRFKLMGDLTLGLNNTAFTNKKLVARFGLESRPLPFLPIRFGTALASGKPLRLGAGTGIETTHWDFSLSTQILVKSQTLTTDVVGGAVAALQFHF